MVHKVAVAEPFQRYGIVTSIMDATEQLPAVGHRDVGITVGPFDGYGSAQWPYGGAAIPLTAGALDRASDCQQRDCR